MDQLEVINIYKSYEGKPLLAGVSFEVETNEILCLLGSSGSGKSTILRIIAGIEMPDSGLVLWQGKNVSEIPAYRRNFGLMFQDYALFPHLNVAENVAFGLRMQRYTQTVIRQKVAEALERVNMSSFGDRRVTDLSGGEQQRIALARALAPAPRLLMLDEPLAALDRSLRVELQEELRTLLHQAGIPTLYVTHDQEEAIVLGDRLALLHGGRIVQTGRIEEVYRYPASRWVASFLGMNGLLNGTVQSTEPLIVETEGSLIHPRITPGQTLPIAGQSVTLLVKPSFPLGELDSSKNDTVSGKVADVRFLGDHYRIELRLPSGARLEFMAAKALPLGDSMTLTLQKGDVLLLLE